MCPCLAQMQPGDTDAQGSFGGVLGNFRRAEGPTQFVAEGHYGRFSVLGILDHYNLISVD